MLCLHKATPKAGPGDSRVSLPSAGKFRGPAAAGREQAAGSFTCPPPSPAQGFHPSVARSTRVRGASGLLLKVPRGGRA